MNPAPSSRPWYREFWVWFALGIVGLGVLSSGSMLVLGLLHPPHELSGDFARVGKATMATDRRFQAAAELGLSGQLELEAERLVLQLTATSAQSLPGQLRLHLEHPVDARQDQSISMQQDRHGRWQAAHSEALALPARTRIIVSSPDDHWALGGRLTEANARRVELVAGRP